MPPSIATPTPSRPSRPSSARPQTATTRRSSSGSSSGGRQKNVGHLTGTSRGRASTRTPFTFRDLSLDPGHAFAPGPRSSLSQSLGGVRAMPPSAYAYGTRPSSAAVRTLDPNKTSAGVRAARTVELLIPGSQLGLVTSLRFSSSRPPSAAQRSLTASYPSSQQHSPRQSASVSRSRSKSPGNANSTPITRSLPSSAVDSHDDVVTTCWWRRFGLMDQPCWRVANLIPTDGGDGTGVKMRTPLALRRRAPGPLPFTLMHDGFDGSNETSSNPASVIKPYCRIHKNRTENEEKEGIDERSEDDDDEEETVEYYNQDGQLMQFKRVLTEEELAQRRGKRMARREQRAASMSHPPPHIPPPTVVTPTLTLTFRPLLPSLLSLLDDIHASRLAAPCNSLTLLIESVRSEYQRVKSSANEKHVGINIGIRTTSSPSSWPSVSDARLLRYTLQSCVHALLHARESLLHHAMEWQIAYREADASSKTDRGAVWLILGEWKEKGIQLMAVLSADVDASDSQATHTSRAASLPPVGWYVHKRKNHLIQLPTDLLFDCVNEGMRRCQPLPQPVADAIREEMETQQLRQQPPQQSSADNRNVTVTVHPTQIHPPAQGHQRSSIQDATAWEANDEDNMSDTEWEHASPSIQLQSAATSDEMMHDAQSRPNTATARMRSDMDSFPYASEPMARTSHDVYTQVSEQHVRAPQTDDRDSLSCRQSIRQVASSACPLNRLQRAPSPIMSFFGGIRGEEQLMVMESATLPHSAKFELAGRHTEPQPRPRQPRRPQSAFASSMRPRHAADNHCDTSAKDRPSSAQHHADYEQENWMNDDAESVNAHIESNTSAEMQEEQPTLSESASGYFGVSSSAANNTDPTPSKSCTISPADTDAAEFQQAHDDESVAQHASSTTGAEDTGDFDVTLSQTTLMGAHLPGQPLSLSALLSAAHTGVEQNTSGDATRAALPPAPGKVSIAPTHPLSRNRPLTVAEVAASSAILLHARCALDRCGTKLYAAAAATPSNPTTLYKCSWCNHAIYCSQGCMIEDWMSGVHPVRCKQHQAEQQQQKQLSSSHGMQQQGANGEPDGYGCLDVRPAKLVPVLRPRSRSHSPVPSQDTARSISSWQTYDTADTPSLPRHALTFDVPPVTIRPRPSTALPRSTNLSRSSRPASRSNSRQASRPSSAATSARRPTSAAAFRHSHHTNSSSSIAHSHLMNGIVTQLNRPGSARPVAQMNTGGTALGRSAGGLSEVDAVLSLGVKRTGGGGGMIRPPVGFLASLESAAALSSDLSYVPLGSASSQIYAKTRTRPHSAHPRSRLASHHAPINNNKKQHSAPTYVSHLAFAKHVNPPAYFGGPHTGLDRVMNLMIQPKPT